jgi:hypothetical protein
MEESKIPSLLEKTKKFFERLTVPTRALVVIMVLFVVFVVGGGIYDIIESPPSLYPFGDSWSSIDPRIGEQTTNESLFNMLMTAMSFVGIFLAYKGTDIRYDRRKANTYIVIGLSFLLLGLAGNYYLHFIKSNL